MSILSNFKEGEIFYLKGSIPCRIRKITKQDLVLRPLTLAEVEVLDRFLEKREVAAPEPQALDKATEAAPKSE